MAINGVGHNYDYLGTTTNYIREKQLLGKQSQRW